MSNDLTRRQALGLIAGAAASAGVSGARAQGRPPKRVTFNFGVAQFLVNTGWCFSVPNVMGFWAEEGLEVVVQGAEGAGVALQQLVGGNVHMTYTGIPTGMELINKGAAIQVVASAYSRNTYYPAVLADSPIQSIQDLKGKTIGLSAVASTNGLWAKAILRMHGLDPDKDVKLVGIGEGAAAMHAVTQGRVQVLQLYEAIYDRYEAEGIRLRRFNQLPALSELSFTQGFFVRRETAERDPDLVVGLLRGIAKAIHYCHANPEAAVRMHWQAFPATRPVGTDPAPVLAREAKVLKNNIEVIGAAFRGQFGHAESHSVEATRDQLRDLGVLTRALPAERYYDPSFVARINAFDPKAIIALPAKA